ncbi:MAG: MFS transporter [Aggregatilineales bacterium]
MTATSANKQTVGIAFLAFIGLGLTSGLLGLAWPSMQQQFGLALDSINILYLVQTAAYTLASFYIGRLVVRFGSGTTLLAGMILMASCMFGIASSSVWILVIVFGLVFGLGSGIIDAGLNLYVATYHSPRQMNWLHASFGIGITIGPLVMTYVLGQNLGWQKGYAFVGIVLLFIIVLLAFTRRWWRNEGFQTAEKKPVRRAGFSESMRVPAIWLGMATFFAYVGLEIGIGQWAYTLLTQSRGIAPEIAGPWVSIYWGAFTGGRILFGVIANRFEVSQALRVCMLGMITGAVLFWWNPVNTVGLIGLVVIGISQAPVFAQLMVGTAARVGPEHAENAISMQMGAVGIGTAILPGLLGTLGKDFGLETMALSFVIMAIVIFLLHELTHLRRLERPVLESA